MFLRMVYDESLAQAAYVIGCQRSGEAIVIDPERDVDRYVDLAREHGLRIVATAETHIHADFLSGSRELAERVGATVYVSDEGDADWKYGWLDKKVGGGSYEHRLLHDGDRFRIGQIEFEVVHSPGHTPEHVSFLVTDRGAHADAPIGIATGDFVFVGDLGRPDLLETAAGMVGVKEEGARRLAASALRFNELADYVQVWPGHGAGSACGKALGAVPTSTVGYEKRFNPGLSLARDEQAFVDFILEGQPEPPAYFGRMKVENRDGPAVLGELPHPRPVEASELRAIPAEAVVVDTRSWSEFRDGHLAGALHAPRGSDFFSAIGSYVDPASEIYLVAPAEEVERFVRMLVRIGLDRVVGWIAPSAVTAGRVALVRSREVDVRGLHDARDRGAFVLDVRRASEHEAKAIPGTVNVAHTRLLEHLNELPKGEPIYVHCRSGARSGAATSLLARKGFDAVNVAGGMLAWGEAKLETVKGDGVATHGG